METKDEQLIQWVNGTSQHALTAQWELSIPSHWIFWKQNGFTIHGLTVDAVAYLRVNEARLLVYPEDVADVQAQTVQLSQHRATEFYFRIVTPGGELQVVRCVAVNESSENNISYKASFHGTHQLIANSTEESLEEAQSASERFTQTGSWQINLHTGQAVFSPNVYRLHDVIPGSLPPRTDTFYRFIHPEEKQLVEKIFRQALSLRVPVHVEYRIVTEANETRFIKLLSKVVRNDNGQDLLIGSMQDITDSKNNELHTKAAQEELGINRQVVAGMEQTAQAGYCLLYLHTRKLFCSDSCSRLFGMRLSGTEPSYESFLVHVHPEEKELFLERFQTAFNKHVFPPTNLRVFRADGKLCHIRMVGRQVRNAGKEPLMVVSARDVTHEQTGEQKIEELAGRNSLLEQTVSHIEASLGAGYWSLNTETRQVYFSPHLYQLHGLKVQSGPGNLELFEKLVHPDDSTMVKNGWENAVTRYQTVNIVYRVIKPEGQLRWLRLEIKPVYTGRNQPWILGVVVDCTEETLLAQKLENQIRFAELISHCILEQLFVSDRSHNMVFCNKQFEKEQHLELSAIKGDNLFDVLPLLKYPAISTALNEVLSGKTFHLPRFHSPVSGKIKEIFALPLRNFEDKTEGILFLIRDHPVTDPAVQPVRIPYFVEDFKELF